jgi:hypothetical protein
MSGTASPAVKDLPNEVVAAFAPVFMLHQKVRYGGVEDGAGFWVQCSEYMNALWQRRGSCFICAFICILRM